MSLRVANDQWRVEIKRKRARESSDRQSPSAERSNVEGWQGRETIRRGVKTRELDSEKRGLHPQHPRKIYVTIPDVARMRQKEMDPYTYVYEYIDKYIRAESACTRRNA